MKKLIQFSLFTFVFMLMIKPASSQIWGMGGATTMISGGSFYIGPELKVGWQYGEEGTEMITLGGKYYPLETTNFDFFVVDTNFNFLLVPSKIKSSITAIEYDYRHYFFDTEADDMFGFYTVFGAGIWIVTSKFVLGDYDKAKYSVPEGLLLKYSSTSLRIPLGVGFDWTVQGRFWFYSDVRLELPANTVNGEYVENNFGASLHINLGARFLLVDL